MNTSVVAGQRSAVPGATQYRGTLRTGAVAALSAIALVAWVITVIWANDMANMPGTMGLRVGERVGGPHAGDEPGRLAGWDGQAAPTGNHQVLGSLRSVAIREPRLKRF